MTDADFDTNLSDNDSVSDLSLKPDSNVLEQGQMLHSVLSDFFKYSDGTGESLNLCETLLLLKNSIDENTKMQKQILATVLATKTTIMKD